MTAHDYAKRHRELHAQFNAGRISGRALEATVGDLWAQARADGIEGAVGALVLAEIRRSMAAARSVAATYCR